MNTYVLCRQDDSEPGGYECVRFECEEWMIESFILAIMEDDIDCVIGPKNAAIYAYVPNAANQAMGYLNHDEYRLIDESLIDSKNWDPDIIIDEYLYDYYIELFCRALTYYNLKEKPQIILDKIVAGEM